MHKLLLRQLKKYSDFGDEIPEKFTALLNAIDQSYQDFESEKKLIERSLEISSKELFDRNQTLNTIKTELENHNEVLESLVVERTKNINKALEEAKEARLVAEHSNKIKSEFLANMSHELRTPLNSVIILAENFVDNPEGNLKERQVEEARIIYNSSKDLLTLINDLLDLSKIEAGKMNIEEKHFVVNNLATSVRNTFCALAEKKSLKLTVDVEESFPKYLISDQFRINQILRNFISNALKFTAQGSIGVSFYLPKEDVIFKSAKLAFNNTIAISVKDTGIGIPKDKTELIFEAFSQADGSTTRKYGGTGLGLSISKELVSLLGGEIHLETVVAQGSNFIIFLPLKAVDIDSINQEELIVLDTEQDKKPNINIPVTTAITDTAKAAPSVNHEEANNQDELKKKLENKKVLIVDDDIKNVFTITKLLETWGMKVTFANDGKQALDKLTKQEKVDIVLMDIMMPVMDGYQTIKQIRADEVLKTLFIVAVTANAMEEDKNRCLNEGFDRYISKPIDKNHLLLTISSLF